MILRNAYIMQRNVYKKQPHNPPYCIRRDRTHHQPKPFVLTLLAKHKHLPTKVQRLCRGSVGSLPNAPKVPKEVIARYENRPEKEISQLKQRRLQQKTLSRIFRFQKLDVDLPSDL